MYFLKKLQLSLFGIFITATAGCFIFTSPLFGRTNWETIKTGNFTIIYKNGYKDYAFEILKTLEFYRPKIQRLTGNYGTNTPIVIEDVGTLTNGITNPVFINIHLFTYPPSISSLGYTENWWADVGVHEYTHMLHLTNTSGIPNFLTSFYGTFLAPNIFSPEWIDEGIAVYSESQFSEHNGRLNDGFFDAYIGATIKDNNFPSIIKATYSPSEFPGGEAPYLYGSEFFNYLSKTYGEDKFAKFFNSYGSSLLSYASPILPSLGLDLTSKRIYGKSLTTLWNNWYEYEKEKSKNFSMEGEKLTNFGWYINYPVIYNNKLFYQKKYATKTAPFNEHWSNKIIEIDLNTGKEKTIISSVPPFSMPIRIHNGNLFYALNEIKKGYANSSYSTYGLYSIIYKKNISTGKTTTIIGDEIRAFDVLPDNNILYSKDIKGKFGSEIYLYNTRTKTKKLLFNTEFLVDEILAPNRQTTDSSRIFVSARKDWQNFNVYNLNIETREFTPLIHTPYCQGSLSAYDNKLFFTSNYEKIYSIYCYDLSNKKTYRLTQNGFASSSAYNEKDSSLFFVGLNSYGNDIYRKKVELKEFAMSDSQFTTPPVFTLNDNEIYRGNYFDNLKTLFPKIHIPLVFSDTQTTELGMMLYGNDAVGDFSYFTNIFYDLGKEKTTCYFNFTNNFFAPLVSYINFDNFNAAKLQLGTEYPFVNKLSSKLLFGLAGNLYNDFSRKEIEPYMTTTLETPNIHQQLLIDIPIESKKINSEINRTGIYAGWKLIHYLSNNQYSVNIKGIYDPDNPATVLPKIYGFQEPIPARTGVILKFEYSQPIFKIRKGLWNPNIFFEDMWGVIFLNQAIAPREATQFSKGLELHLETKIFFTLPVDIGIRASFLQGTIYLEPFIRSP
ncbi:MAG: hypothetical protein WC614_11785 [bacterium]